jgi:hypothetical protein
MRPANASSWVTGRAGGNHHTAPYESRHMQISTADLEGQITCTIPHALKASGLGRSKFYVLLASGAIDARKCGGRTLVVVDSLRDYLEGLPPAFNT